MVPGAGFYAPAVEMIRDLAVGNAVDQEGQNARFFAVCTNQTQASAITARCSAKRQRYERSTQSGTTGKHALTASAEGMSPERALIWGAPILLSSRLRIEKIVVAICVSR
jgi:hypothetical protein